MILYSNSNLTEAELLNIDLLWEWHPMRFYDEGAEDNPIPVPKEKQKWLLTFIERNFVMIKSINKNHSEYSLKQSIDVSKKNGLASLNMTDFDTSAFNDDFYFYSGAWKMAFFKCGYSFNKPWFLNWTWNISEKSPYIIAQKKM